MFGIRKLFLFSILILSFTLTFSEESFLWKMFSRGKSIFANLKNQSDRRTEVENLGPGQSGAYETEPEHREIEQEHSPVAYDNYYGDYTGYTQVIHRDNMELYSLLGGLSFASLLATTLVILSRRNGSLLRSSGQDDYFRKNNKAQGDYQLVINVPKLLYRMGRHFTRPWWFRSSEEERKAKGFQPISLVHPELFVN